MDFLYYFQMDLNYMGANLSVSLGLQGRSHHFLGFVWKEKVAQESDEEIIHVEVLRYYFDFCDSWSSYSIWRYRYICIIIKGIDTTAVKKKKQGLVQFRCQLYSLLFMWVVCVHLSNTGGLGHSRRPNVNKYEHWVREAKKPVLTSFYLLFYISTLLRSSL